MTDRPVVRIYIGSPPWVGKHDLKVDPKYRALFRHWMWRSGVGFGAITTFTAMQLGPWANAAYVLGMFLSVELVMKVDRWAPKKPWLRDEHWLRLQLRGRPDD